MFDAQDALSSRKKTIKKKKVYRSQFSYRHDQNIRMIKYFPSLIINLAHWSENIILVEIIYEKKFDSICMKNLILI